ncbi:MAG TPA: hypothetical protein VNM90_01110, partial [Haliangium sp.]|nr:hypothetical protein [Haliangium sp.]
MTTVRILVSLSVLAAGACHAPTGGDLEPAPESAADAAGHTDSGGAATAPTSVTGTPLPAARLPRAAGRFAPAHTE